MQNLLRTLILFFFIAIAHTATPASAEDIAPEPITRHSTQRLAHGTDFMIVTAHALASNAARDMLIQGGNAVDAAIAAQLVLNVVEPQSSGIGGGGFLLFYDKTSDSLIAYDGRETAPFLAMPDLFLQKDGTPIPFLKAVKSGKAVGTPGLLSMLEMAHTQHGKLSWSTLFTPAISIARSGFPISPRLHQSIVYAQETSPLPPAFSALFLDKNQKAKPIGSKLKNLPMAETFQHIAKHGAQSFYHGPIATDIAQAATQKGGVLQAQDLANYRPKTRAALCEHYRNYKICSIGAPSSGGITLLQTLGMLSHFTLDKPYSPQQIHLILEAQKRAFADRNHYIADHDSTPTPSDRAFLDKTYLTQRAKDISLTTASPTPAPHGMLRQGISFGKDTSFDAPSTTHLSIVDAQGNAVSMTSSVEHSFGSGIMVRGFVLNNQMTDFAFVPKEKGQWAANAVAPLKRPRSSMTPVIIFAPDNTLYAVLGSPGGSSIIGYVTKTIIALLDWGMALDAAIAAPHFMHKNTNALIEPGNGTLHQALEKMGHKVTEEYSASGVNAIIRSKHGDWLGAADPRREGLPIGK